MNLNELLEVSEYIDRLRHGEKPKIPESEKAATFIRGLRLLKNQKDYASVISTLNGQIILKNRNTFDRESAKKVYDAFINAE